MTDHHKHISDDLIRELRESGLSYREIAEKVQASKAFVEYRLGRMGLGSVPPSKQNPGR